MEPLRTIFTHHATTIVHTHNMCHVLYWGHSAWTAHSMFYGFLSGTLGFLTIALALVEYWKQE